MAEPTLHEMLLELDRRLYPEQYPRCAHDLFKSLLEQANGARLRERPGQEQLRAIGDLVFRRAGIRYRKKSCGDDFTLTRTLLKQQGSCLGITTIYLCLSDALDLSFRAILYDGHIAPCFILDNERVWHLDPITMRRPCDSWLATVYHGAPLPGDAGEPLSVQEFLGVYLCNRAVFALSGFASLAEILKELDLVSELFPGYPTPWINRAQILRRMGRDDEAREAAQKALALGAGPLGRRHLATEGVFPNANPGGQEPL